MGLFHVVCMALLTAVARTQVLQNCSVDTSPSVVSSTEDAAALASSLQCSNGDIAVEWVGQVFVEETVFVTGSSSLNITGAGPDAVADGGGNTQLFYVDGDSSLHLSDMTLTNGNATLGGAIFANKSSVSFSGSMLFVSNSASTMGGAVYAGESNVFWDGDGTEFSNNSAGIGGGAIHALGSTLFWEGDGARFSFNSAEAHADTVYGGAIFAYESTVSWVGDSTQFIANSVTSNSTSVYFPNYDAFGAAIYAASSNVSWEGSSTQFTSNSGGYGAAIYAGVASCVSWEGNGTLFSNNSAVYGGAIRAYESNVSWNGDGTKFISNSADYGGAIYAAKSAVYWAGDGTHFSSNSASQGGAISAFDSQTVSWAGDGTTFISNSAIYGGAILADLNSRVFWDGDDTAFISNSVDHSTYDSSGASGGAIYAYNVSTVSWDGDGTHFSFNYAGYNGGAIYADESSNVSWDGDGAEFISNSASLGGAIAADALSNVSWDGDGTLFRSNNALSRGGAIYGFFETTVFWQGDNTLFSNNSASFLGGAICTLSNVSWDGDGTHFSLNTAGDSGGAIYIWSIGIQTDLGWDGSTNFSGNVAGSYGGAIVLDDLGNPIEFSDVAFINNSAGAGGGALFLNSVYETTFTNASFQSNSAGTGGAVLGHDAGFGEDTPATFSTCIFSDNKANGDGGRAGGAVDTLLGYSVFHSCDFESNSASIGGALRLGGNADVIQGCSFVSNSASTRGLAVAVVTSVNISGSLFEANELWCAADSYYREDTDEEGSTARFQAVCLACPDWHDCSNCTIEGGDLTPTCEVPLQHTTAKEPGVTLETLYVDPGYWRATTTSETMLACYNQDACRGGLTGADSYCASGYKGPYCAVCELDYSRSLAHACTRCSSSRRQGLMAATVIAALVAALAVVTVFNFLVSADVGEGNPGWFRRRVLRAVPVQALKIIVVVWQILTQFAAAANVSYPGVYQDFLNAIDVVNFDLGSVLAAGCLWSGVDFHGRLLVSTIGPLVVVGFLAMTYLIAVRKNRSASFAEKIRHKHQTALLLLTFLVYSSVSSMVFQTFACETLDDEIEYLRADYRIHCTDAKHKAFEVYAGIMVFVYPVGIPLLYAALLFGRRDVLAKADADRTAAQSIAGLWEAYRPERFYYEVIECGRRILLTGVVVFIFPNDAAQIAITILIAFFFFTVFEILSPYSSQSDMWLSRGGHVIVFLSMFDLLLLKVDVSGERAQSQAAFAGVLVAGHVLMVLAIVVEVVGICCASRKREVVDGGAEASERPRTGSNYLPAFESAPAPWASFMRRGSVSEKTGPTRSVSGMVGTTGRPSV